jgi:hypothetical protein
MTSNDHAAERARFDVRGFARTAHGNHRDELSFAGITKGSLPIDSVRLIRYLAVLESSTMEHLRNLLVTATHKDARVTAFLVTWAFEKFWVADALNAVLEANGTPRGSEPESTGPRRKSAAESGERRGPIRRAILAIAQGVPVVAVHTTTGLIDEWITRIAYERLSVQAGSVELGTIIERLLAVKQRHADFFEDESRRRLADSPKAVAQTSKTLAHLAWPIGAIDQPAADRSFFESFTFGGGEGLKLAATVGNRIQSLPGLDAAVAGAVARRLLP